MSEIGTFTLPCDLDCDPAGCCGRLEHTLLKNTFLALPPRKLYQRLSQASAGGETLKDRTQQEFERLSETLEKGYSPARLVKRLQPFAGLSSDQRHELKTKLHEWFRAEFRPKEMQELLKARWNAFHAASERFCECGDPDSGAGKAIYDDLVEAIQDFRSVLNKLPKGIWCFQ